MPIRNLGERAIRSDITTKAFDREWRRLPLALRALLLVAYPIKGIHDFAFGTREQIAKSLGTDLLPSRDDVLIDDFIEPFFDLVVNTRDRLLLAQLDHRTEGDAMTVGVVYGARHMRAVIRFLTDRQGYRITSREFLTVMSL